jgi:hypothetical protein
MWPILHSVFIECIFVVDCRELSNDRRQFPPLVVEVAHHIYIASCRPALFQIHQIFKETTTHCHPIIRRRALSSKASEIVLWEWFSHSCRYSLLRDSCDIQQLVELHFQNRVS